MGASDGACAALRTLHLSQLTDASRASTIFAQLVVQQQLGPHRLVLPPELASRWRFFPHLSSDGCSDPASWLHLDPCERFSRGSRGGSSGSVGEGILQEDPRHRYRYCLGEANKTCVLIPEPLPLANGSLGTWWLGQLVRLVLSAIGRCAIDARDALLADAITTPAAARRSQQPRARRRWASRPCARGARRTR